MSLYEDKIAKKSKALVPPRYAELIQKYQMNYIGSRVATIGMTIINLNTFKDYNKIATALKELKGVIEIGDFQPKKLIVTYDRHLINLETIVYKISKLGYRYINRF